MIATAYLISLGIFFVFLVIATIVYMVSKASSKSKKKKSDRYDYDEDDDYEDFEEEDNETSIFDEAYAQKKRTSLDDEIESVAADVEEAMKSLNMSMESVAQPMPQVSPESDSAFAPEPDSAFAPEPQVAPVIPELDSAFAPEPQVAPVTPELDSAFAPEPQVAQSVEPVVPELDSAFAPEPQVAQSIAPVTPVSTIKENKPAGGNYIWFNKEDVADRPDYKPEEMYYHYFHTADECIEDLLMEMYDCALVRTEEIRYIAYGIEPRDVAMRDVLATGAADFNASRKKKEPNTEDLARIYDKWCSYVDKLFEKVEVRADEATVVEIRRLLCEYGKNDVDTLIQGV